MHRGDEAWQPRPGRGCCIAPSIGMIRTNKKPELPSREESDFAFLLEGLDDRLGTGYCSFRNWVRLFWGDFVYLPEITDSEPIIDRAALEGTSRSRLLCPPCWIYFAHVVRRNEHLGAYRTLL